MISSLKGGVAGLVQDGRERLVENLDELDEAMSAAA